MKRCAYCGRESPDEALHCSECGTGEFVAPKPPRLPVHRAYETLFDTGGHHPSKSVWDFMFGVTLIGGGPIVVCGSICVVATWIPNPALVVVLQCSALVAAVAALMWACIWRSQHRLLRSSTFVLEVLVAFLMGGLYVLVWVTAGYAAYRAD